VTLDHSIDKNGSIRLAVSEPQFLPRSLPVFGIMPEELVKAIQSLIQLAYNITVAVLEPWRLSHIDLFLNFSVEECRLYI
jgi:hypothetical protein